MLLGAYHGLCRAKHLPADMAEDFVHETYIRFRLIEHGGWSREQSYEWLRNTLINLMDYARRRRSAVHGLWVSERGDSIEALSEQGIDLTD
jgi:DNA-directed RNA polymerase specialized sigma24 family protein